MIKNKFLIFFFIIVVTSCNADKEIKHEIPSINIEINDEYRKINCSDVLDLNRIVKLENTEKSIIGIVDDVIVNDSFIYVLDKQITKSIFIFTDKGQFVNRISRNGKGPNEYISLKSFAYDQHDNILLVLDGTGRKLLCFDKLGIYKESIKLDDYYAFIHVLDKDHFVFYSNFSSRSYMQFSITSKEGKVLNRFKKISKKHFSWGYPDNVFCKNNNSSLFVIPYENTIYSISENMPKECISFKFNGYFIDPKAENMSSKEADDLYRNKNIEGKIVNRLKGLAQVESILYFSFNFQHNNFSVFYDIDKGRLIQFGKLTSDINHLFIGNTQPIGQTQNELIFVLEAHKELKRYNRLKIMPKYAQHTEKYKTLFESPQFDLNSNPALLFFKVKQ